MFILLRESNNLSYKNQCIINYDINEFLHDHIQKKQLCEMIF